MLGLFDTGRSGPLPLAVLVFVGLISFSVSVSSWSREIRGNVVVDGNGFETNEWGTTVIRFGNDDVGVPPGPLTNNVVIDLEQHGQACSDASACASGFCVDGVCCDFACAGSCESCNGENPGTCGPVPRGTNCRASGDQACDAPEVCDGVTGNCPTDGPAPGGTVCRAAAFPCDAEEWCDGVAFTCPADTIAVAGTVCRRSRGGCDPAEICDGVSTGCPDDLLMRAGFVCRLALGVNDVAEVCDGRKPACPVENPEPSQNNRQASPPDVFDITDW